MINVMIVEDDPMVAQLNKRYIDSLSEFKVVELAQNGQDALNIIRSKDIDLIILDIYMPKIDGLSFLKEMRRRFFRIDVILVTASNEASSIDAALKLGAVDYLIKPFTFERLKNALDNYLARYKLLQDKEAVNQEDIDKITKSEARSINKLAKGLTEKTLSRIREFMKKNSDKFLSSDVISEKLGISKVTVRRYLEYLQATGSVKVEIEYGTGGRPGYLYKYLP